MKCKHCGTENPDNTRYCVHCGNKLNREKDREDNLIGLLVVVGIIGLLIAIGVVVSIYVEQGWIGVVLFVVAGIFFWIGKENRWW